jgi:putative membrane protein
VGAGVLNLNQPSFFCFAMILRFIVRILANALAIYLAAYFVVNFYFPNDWRLLLLAGLILAIFNAILKPILKLISAPLIILTFGLFTLVINMTLLWLLAQFMPELKITGLWAYFWGVIILSAVNWLIEGFIKPRKHAD